MRMPVSSPTMMSSPSASSPPVRRSASRCGACRWPKAMTVRSTATPPMSITSPVTAPPAASSAPSSCSAVNRATAQALAAAFRCFDADAVFSVAVLTGSGGYFCAGYDLKEVAGGGRAHRVESGDGPMGPTRLKLSKPVIAAVEGPAVAGGLELALWCDLRVAARDAVFGVYCRRFGVPLLDLGTIRLPRLIGHSR